MIDFQGLRRRTINCRLGRCLPDLPAGIGRRERFRKFQVCHNPIKSLFQTTIGQPAAHTASYSEGLQNRNTVFATAASAGVYLTIQKASFPVFPFWCTPGSKKPISHASTCAEHRLRCHSACCGHSAVFGSCITARTNTCTKFCN